MAAFFFQAEDGIRCTSVTGVQTCALPILPSNWADSDETDKAPWTTLEATDVLDNGAGDPADNVQVVLLGEGECLLEIGRASCRERGRVLEVDIGCDDRQEVSGWM